MKLRTRKSQKAAKQDVLDEIIARHGAKGKNADIRHIHGNFKDDDNAVLTGMAEQLVKEKKVFRYKGQYYPWKELSPLYGTMYDTIKADILARIAEWEKTQSTPVDPVHFLDAEIEYFEDAEKINISWDALISVINEMGRRGELDVEN